MSEGGDKPPRPQQPARGPLLGGVRARLMVLVAAATIPIVGIAGTNAWNAYTSVRESGSRTAAMLREVAVARHGAAVDNLKDIVVNVAARRPLMDMPPEQCDAELARLRELAPERYSNFWLLDAEGRLVCSGLPTPRGVSYAHLDYVPQIIATRAFVLGEFTIGVVSRRAVVPAVAPIFYPDGTLRGMVAGSLFLDVFQRSDRPPPISTPYFAWLIDQDSSPLPLSGAPITSLPPQPVLASLVAERDATIDGVSRQGEPYAYSIEEIEPGLLLMIGLPVGEATQAAFRALMRRLAELTVFLIACLGAIVIGVELAVSRPLRRVAVRVREWSPGRPLPPVAPGTGPQEVRDLDDALTAAATAIEERDRELTGALRQRDLLMAEIHHRVKNNLQIVASLLNLQAGRLRNTEARADFAMARDRVQALSTLHRHLYLHQSFERISLRPFLEELSRQLSDALGAGSDSNMKIRIQAEDVELGSDQAISLALLVTEAVSNAMRYAFPDGRGGTIDISLEVRGREAVLRVVDDGIGFGEAKPHGDGLGLQLIEGFASHLGGAAEITGDGGTSITVRFPVRVRDQPAERDVA